LLVLSGLKVAVFARIAQGAIRPLLGRHATWPALALIGVYALAGGATPAAVRAALMGGLAIAAQRLGRPAHVWTSLALTAAAMLGWRPELAWDVGFQLSFAGTAAIILLTPGIERRLPWMPQFVREPFAVTCAAQVVAGLVLGPLSVLPDLARVVAVPIAGVLAYLEQVAYLLARVPAAAVSIPRFPAWAGVAYYGAVGPAIAAGQMRGRARRIALLGAVGAPVLIATAAAAM